MTFDKLKGEFAYIAGPMTGRKDWNIEAFAECERVLREAGAATVFNPATRDSIERYERGEIDRAAIMTADIQSLINATSLVLLPGYASSAGARVEFLVAAECGLRIFYWSANDGEFFEFRREHIERIYDLINRSF